MKYLLFIYPCEDTWDSQESNQTFAEQLVNIVEDETLKFVYGENHTIFNFTSDLSQSELFDYIDLIKDDVPDFMYFLVQNPKNVSSDMEEDQFKHLMGKKRRGRKPKTQKPEFDVETFMIEHRKRVEDFLNNFNCNLTLDEILDKIIDKGINSLTTAEKNKLDEYSREA